MVKYGKSVRRAKRLKEEEPKIPDYIGACILQICNKLSFKSNFINYTYRDEMIGDAMENCIVSIKSFDPDKSNNPFAYFTRIAYNAYVRRIQKEQKQQYIKHKNLGNFFFGTEEDQQNNELSNKVIGDYEEKMRKQKEKVAKNAKK